MRNKGAIGQRQIRPLFLAVSAASLAWQVHGRALGAVDSWVSEDGVWTTTDTGDWSTGAVPGAGDTVDITDADGVFRLIQYDYTGSGITLSSLTVNNTGGAFNDLDIGDAVSLAAGTENIGDSNSPTAQGKGELIQTAGNNAITNMLFIGSYPNDNGLYSLQGGALAITGTGGENVGNGGAATFAQTAGLNDLTDADPLIIANIGGTGTYSLSGTGSLSASGNLEIGSGGSGTFSQSGGTASVSVNVYVGFTSPGSYLLSSGEITMNSGNVGEYIGDSGTGSFSQTGGSNLLNAATLYLGNSAGVSGTYSLSGSGLLSTSESEYIGNIGNGTFIQSGGTNSVAGSMFFGANVGASGTYSLSGTGLLTVTGDENIADSGSLDLLTLGSTAAFNQSGGSNQISGNLVVGSYPKDIGTYSLSSTGALSVTGNETVANNGTATFTQSNGSNTIGSVTGSSSLYVADFFGSNGTYDLSGGSLTIVSESGGENIGFGGNGTFIQTGGVNNMDNGASLYLGNSANSNGFYSLGPSGTLTTSANEIVGDAGNGTFIQSGGINQASETVNTLYVGDVAKSTGLYSLSGSGAVFFMPVGYIGESGSGTFIQSAGSATFAGENASGNGLSIGDQSGGQGLYSLSAGNITITHSETVGNFGTGTFAQSGGTNSVSGSLTLAAQNGGNGIYSLSGTGLLSVGGGENIADSGSSTAPGGTGVFTQAGGTNDLTAGTLFIGSYPADHGTYNLQSGLLEITGSSGGENIGNGGTAVFNQTGGANTLAAGNSIDIANIGGSGTYSLSGTGMMTVGGNMSVGGSAASAGGTGSLSVGGSADLTVDGTLKIWNSPGTQVMIAGGIVLANQTVNMTTITQTGGASALGPLSGAGSLSIGNPSPSNVFASMTVSSIQQNAVTINDTGALVINGGIANTINSLSIAANGLLTLKSNALIINYGSGPDPISTIRSYLVSGYDGGAWDGPGINSDSAALPANNAHYGVGYADFADAGNPAHLSSGQIEVMYALYGDANLDGVVNGDDFTILAGNLGKPAASWDQGDFNYDGVVNGDDFTLLVGNLGKASNGAAVTLPASDYAAIDAFAAANGLMADVPEPATLALLTLGTLGMLRRRRRTPKPRNANS